MSLNLDRRMKMKKSHHLHYSNITLSVFRNLTALAKDVEKFFCYFFITPWKVSKAYTAVKRSCPQINKQIIA